jgi:hypothetical protein
MYCIKLLLEILCEFIVDAFILSVLSGFLPLYHVVSKSFFRPACSSLYVLFLLLKISVMTPGFTSVHYSCSNAAGRKLVIYLVTCLDVCRVLTRISARLDLSVMEC